MSKPINFPTIVNVGMQHSLGDRTWEWDGNGWGRVDPAPVAPRTTFTESKSAPSSPVDGDKWKNTQTDVTYTYLAIEDAWVEL